MCYESDVLDKICENVSVLEYASANGFEFERKGKNWWTNCPNHQDDTPSLMIDDKGRFHCFSCQIHGRIIDWLKEVEHLSFKEAVSKAARLASIEIAQTTPSLTVRFNKTLANKKKLPKVEHIILPNTEYEKYDPAYPEEWEQEGISKEAMDFFDIRFDPRASRIVYPVRLLNGDLIGVKGRTIFPHKVLNIPKYMNYYEIGSADFLQGLDKTKDDVFESGEIILFEGIKSCMKAWGWGYRNTAAVESHAINAYQMRILLQLGVDIVVAFDSDVNYKDKGIKTTLDTLSKFTNVYVINGENILGGAEAKNSPVDCGEQVWEHLYKNKERWKINS